METLRALVIVVHLVGFAVLFGAWVVEVAGKRKRVTPLMNWGLLVALVAGLALAAPWGVDHPLNYAKIGVKLVVVVAIGALLGILSARQRRGASVPPALFWLVGILTLGNAALAVLW